MLIPRGIQSSTVEDLYNLVVILPSRKLEISEKHGFEAKDLKTGMTLNLTRGNEDHKFCMPDYAGLRITWDNKLAESFEFLEVAMTFYSNGKKLGVERKELTGRLGRPGKMDLLTPGILESCEDKIIIEVYGLFRPIYNLADLRRMLDRLCDSRYSKANKLIEALGNIKVAKDNTIEAPKEFRESLSLYYSKEYSDELLKQWKALNHFDSTNTLIDRKCINTLKKRFQDRAQKFLDDDIINLKIPPVTLEKILGVEKQKVRPGSELEGSIKKWEKIKDGPVGEYVYAQSYEVVLFNKNEIRLLRRGKTNQIEKNIDYRWTLSAGFPQKLVKSMRDRHFQVKALRYNVEKKKYEPYALKAAESLLPAPKGEAELTWYDLDINLSKLLKQKMQIAITYKMDDGEEYLVLRKPMEVHELNWYIQVPVISDIRGLATEVPKDAKQAKSKYSFAIIGGGENQRLGFMLPFVIGYNPENSPNLSNYLNVFAHVTAFSENDKANFLFGGGVTLAEFVQLAVGVDKDGESHLVVGICPRDLWSLFDK